MPGMAMSRSRHLVLEVWREARNCSADEKVRTENPSSLSKSGSDSRTDSSSSTTQTSGRVFIMDLAFLSATKCFTSGQGERFMAASAEEVNGRHPSAPPQ